MLPEKDTAHMPFEECSSTNTSNQAHLILLLVIASPLNLCLTLRLYDSLARYLLIVPYPIVIRYSTAQILLKMRPVGKLTSLVPGRTNALASVAVFDAEPSDGVLAKIP